MFDVVLKNCRIWNVWGSVDADIGISDEKISLVAPTITSNAVLEIDLAGKNVLPGLIDPHVHLRDPGFEHKETWSSGTAAAVRAGITCLMDMPNTKPPVVDEDSLFFKANRAQKGAWTDFGFFVAGFRQNAEMLPKLAKHDSVAGIKVFMGSTTGSMLSDETSLVFIAKQMSNSDVRKVVAVHSELESVLRSSPFAKRKDAAHHLKRPASASWEGTGLAIDVFARDALYPVHICHTSTSVEVWKIARAKRKGLDVSAEATPHHLLMDAEYHERTLGTFAKMNPPLRFLYDRETLLDGLRFGQIDMLATDHAPHTVDEKRSKNAPSGVPGVDTLFRVLMLLVFSKRLSMEQAVAVGSFNAAKRFGILHKGVIAEGFDADMIVLSDDFNRLYPVQKQDIHTKCGWSPFWGWLLPPLPEMVFLRGVLVAKNGNLFVSKPTGRLARFGFSK